MPRGIISQLTSQEEQDEALWMEVERLAAEEDAAEALQKSSDPTATAIPTTPTKRKRSKPKT